MIALITGATSGIGQATAIKLAAIGYDIIITGRRKERLEELSEKLISEKNTRVHALFFDIRDREATRQAVESLPTGWKDIDVLVNNAGLASGLDHFHEGNIDDWEAMIDTNLKGLLYITRFIAPGMTRRKKGHIINIGSIAGKETYEKGNVYCATKHGVEALTKGMRIDLLKHNIKVSSVCPGAVDTEFSRVRFHGDDKKAKEVYKGYTPLYAEDIAEAIVFVVTRPAHVNINDLLIMPTAQANTSHIDKKE